MLVCFEQKDVCIGERIKRMFWPLLHYFWIELNGLTVRMLITIMTIGKYLIASLHEMPNESRPFIKLKNQGIIFLLITIIIKVSN